MDRFHFIQVNRGDKQSYGALYPVDLEYDPQCQGKPFTVFQGDQTMQIAGSGGADVFPGFVLCSLPQVDKG